MKYIKLFNKHSEYDAYDILKPNISYCILENEVHYNPIQQHDEEDNKFPILEVHPIIVENVYIDLNTGDEIKYNGWSATDYISIEGFTTYFYKLANGTSYGAYYDDNKNRIANTNSTIIPDNAKYIRLSVKSSEQTTSTNVYLSKKTKTISDIYLENHYIHNTTGNILAYNGWNVFKTEEKYIFYDSQYQASYYAKGNVYQSGKTVLEKPQDGYILFSNNTTSLTYMYGDSYKYIDMINDSSNTETANEEE